MEAQTSIADLLSRYDSGEVPYISVEELKMKQQHKNILVLDARSMEEFKVSHLQNSVFVGYDDFQLDSMKKISKNAEIIVYCSLGIRSGDIAAKLKKAGFEKVWNLYGGIFQWKNKGYSVYDEYGRETEKVHAYSEKWAKYLKNGEKVY